MSNGWWGCQSLSHVATQVTAGQVTMASAPAFTPATGKPLRKPQTKPESPGATVVVVHGSPLTGLELRYLWSKIPASFPVPGGPKKSASSRRPTNAAVTRSKTRLRFIFLLKLKSKLWKVLCGSRNWACFLRRSSSRSPRRVSSSDTRKERKSIGAIGSAWACCSRVSNTAAMPPRRSCRKA